MSVRASMFRQVLRVTGNMLASTEDPRELRKKVQKLSKHQPGVHKDVKLTKFNIEAIPAYWFEPEDRIPGAVLYYLHGGGYIMCSANTTHADMISRLAKAARCKVLAIDYRLAPEHPFPAALDDSLIGYRWLLEQDVNFNRIAIGGDSAGGGLAFSSLLKIRDQQLLMPVAAVGLSPWADLSASGESLQYNVDKDLILPGDGIREGAEYYLAGADPENPYASPIFGDMHELPHSLIQVGGDEVLLDDSRRLAAALKKAGTPVLLQEWAGMQHVWQTFSMFIPEGRQAIDQIGMFLQTRFS